MVASDLKILMSRTSNVTCFHKFLDEGQETGVSNPKFLFKKQFLDMI